MGAQNFLCKRFRAATGSTPVLTPLLVLLLSLLLRLSSFEAFPGMPWKASASGDTNARNLCAHLGLPPTDRFKERDKAYAQFMKKG